MGKNKDSKKEFVEKANSIGFRCSDETDATFEQDSETWEMITL